MRPILLVIDDERINRHFVSAIMSRLDWSVIEASDGVAGLSLARMHTPSLILMDVMMPPPDGYTLTATIRADPSALCSTPIVAFTAIPVGDPDKWLARGFDGHLAKPCAPDALIAAAGAWHPDGVLKGACRLEAVFGAAEIHPLLAGFRDQLETAILSLDRGVADAGLTDGLAHRIAGAAGTLGFAEVGAAWRAVSLGDIPARSYARQMARLAIAAIDRDWQFAQLH